MSQATDFLEAALLDHLFNRATYSAAASLYLALFTAAPGEAGGGTEVTGGSYARIAITNDDTSWIRTGNLVENLNLLTAAAATANWGTVTHWALMDAASGGNMLIYGRFNDDLGDPAPIIVNNGATFRVAAGKIRVTFNFRSNYTNGKMLDHFFGIDPFTPPATVHLALFTANPTDAGGGTEVSTSGTAYAREAVTLDDTEFGRTADLIENLNDIEWAEATANYGNVTGQAAMDAGSGGNMLWWAALTPAQFVGTGSQFAFTPGQYRFRLG